MMTDYMEAAELVMGPFPSDDKRVSLDIRVLQDVEEESYVRKLITYQSEPLSRTPAYLCIPKQALANNTKLPAVLCLHPTDARFGHQVVVGLGGRPGRQYASELAQRGFVQDLGHRTGSPSRSVTGYRFLLPA